METLEQLHEAIPKFDVITGGVVMASKAASVFSIEIDGVPRSLLSVRHQGNGGLFLTSRLGMYYTFDDQPNAAVVDRHISVHEPDENGFAHITHKTWLDNGEEQHIATRIEPPKGQPLLWLIFTSMVGRVSGDTGIYQNRAKDTVLPVGSFNQGRATLFYSVVVADRSFDVTSLNLEGSTMHTLLTGSIFTISVATTYLNAPAPVDGLRIQASTSKTMPTNEPSGDYSETKYMTPAIVWAFHRASIRTLRRVYIEKAREAVPGEFDSQGRPTDKRLLQLMGQFTPMPIFP